MNMVNSAVFHSKDREITLIDKYDSLMNRVNSAVFHLKDREITLIDKDDSLINRVFCFHSLF